MNLSKTKAHAIDPFQPFSITLHSGKVLSTFEKHGQPHSSYNYLGMWIFTHTAALQLYTFLQNEITGFFDTLAPLPLTFSEYILLINKQLVPVITYRSLAQQLPNDTIQLLQKLISSELCAATPLFRKISRKDIYVPRMFGGLGLSPWKYQSTKQPSIPAFAILTRKAPLIYMTPCAMTF